MTFFKFDCNTDFHSNEIWLEKVNKVILRHVNNNKLHLTCILNEINMSRRTFERKLKRLTGLSPRKYVTQLRMKKAHFLLISQNNMKIREISIEVGFSNPEYFSRLFKEKYGYTPYTLMLSLKDENKQISQKNDFNKT